MTTMKQRTRARKPRKPGPGLALVCPPDPPGFGPQLPEIDVNPHFVAQLAAAHPECELFLIASELDRIYTRVTRYGRVLGSLAMAKLADYVGRMFDEGFTQIAVISEQELVNEMGCVCKRFVTRVLTKGTLG